jgi:peptide-methionine (R)-S-oxide reductase
MEKILLRIYTRLQGSGNRKTFTGKYNDFDELGEYYCAVCGNHLFRSIQNFQAAVAGQVFLKQIKKEYIIKEIQLMEWKG